MRTANRVKNVCSVQKYLVVVSHQPDCTSDVGLHMLVITDWKGSVDPKREKRV